MNASSTASDGKTKAKSATMGDKVKNDKVEEETFALLGTEIIDITVGPEKELFLVHKQILYNKVPSLAEKINTSSLLVQWIYFGSLPRLLRHPANSNKHRFYDWCLSSLYYLAESLGLIELRDLVMDRAYDAAKEMVVGSPTFAAARRLYASSVEGSPLRLFVIRDLRFRLLESRDDWDSAGEFQKFMQENEEISRDILESLKCMKGEKVLFSYEYPKCDYHHHAKGDACPYTSNRNQKQYDGKEYVDILGPEILEFTVGVDKKIFRVHKKFLCDKLDYLAKMFGSGFLEATQGTADFPEDEVAAFELLIQWLYFGELKPLSASRPAFYEMLRNYLHLYGLAEKLCIVELKDKVMDKLYNTENKNGSLILDDAPKAYHLTPDGSPLRRYASRALRYWIAIAKSEVNNTRILTAMKMNDDLGRDVLALVRSDSKGLDPRKAPRCDYHHHGKDVACPYLS